MKIVILFLVNCCYLFSTKDEELLNKIYFNLNKKILDIKEMVNDKDQKYDFEIKKVKKEIVSSEDLLRNLKKSVDNFKFNKIKEEINLIDIKISECVMNNEKLNSEQQIYDKLLNDKTDLEKKIKEIEKRMTNFTLWHLESYKSEEVCFDLHQKMVSLFAEIGKNESNLYAIRNSSTIYTPDEKHEMKRLHILIAQKKQEYASLEFEYLKKKLDLINFEIKIFNETRNEIIINYTQFSAQFSIEELNYFENYLDIKKIDKEKIESSIQRCNSEIELFKSQENEAKNLELKYKPLNVQYKFD